MKSLLTIIIATALIGGGIWLLTKQDGGETSNPSSSTAVATPKELKPTTTTSSPSIRFSYLIDPSIPWQTRVQKLRNLDPSTLTQEDIDQLYAHLHQRNPDHNPESWWVVLNEIMETIRKGAIGRDRITHTFIAILDDSSRDEVTRDYAAQHLSQWITPDRPNLPYEEDPSKRAHALNLLTKQITDPALQNSSIPGTVLNSLTDATRAGLKTQSHWEQLTPWLEKTIATARDDNPGLRTTAINTVGELDKTEFYPQIKALATDHSQDFGVRLNSIAALGHLMQESDISLLQEIAQREGRLHHAINAAINKFQKKNNNL